LADLAASKIAYVGAALPGNPQNAVIAGGASNTLSNFTDANNNLNNGPGNITYVVNYSNAGPGNARNVRLEDFIPSIPADIRNAAGLPLFGNATLNGVPIAVILAPTSAGGAFAIDCAQP